MKPDWLMSEETKTVFKSLRKPFLIVDVNDTGSRHIVSPL